MTTTITQHIEALKAEFAKLGKSRKSQLRREAAELISSKPYMADVSSFWRGLSARQVLSVV
jgi:hypothetical protein